MKVPYSSLLFIPLIISVIVHAQDGKLDSSFGENGIQKTAVLPANRLPEYAKKILAVADGSSYIVFNFYTAYSTQVAAIVKFLPTGKVDSSYGTHGFSEPVLINDVKGAILHDNTILMVGTATNVGHFSSDFLIVRYNAQGWLDSTFDKDGIVTTDFNEGPDIAEDIIIQQNKILVGGSAYNFEFFNDDFAMARYHLDGSLDASFGKEGRVTTHRTQETANAITLLNDQIILAGTQIDSNTLNNLALIRYHANGIVDSSFGTNGWVMDFAGVFNSVESVAEVDDKIVIAGSVFNPNTFNNEFLLVRYNADGTLDSAFDEDAVVIVNLGIAGTSPSIAVDGDQIIVAGYVAVSNGFDFDVALTRYNGDGSVDSDFGNNGIATVNLDNNGDGATCVTIQNEKILIGALVSPSGDIGIARFTIDGALDFSFNDLGYALTYYPSSQTYFTSGVVHEKKIIAAGYAHNANNFTNDLIIMRHDHDGKPDSTLNQTGVLINHFGSDEVAQAVTVQNDKLMVAAQMQEQAFIFKTFTLARYMPDGRFDSTFENFGLVREPFGFGDEIAEAVIVHSDNIFVAGNVYNPLTGGIDFGLAKYNADGKVDLSFGNGGLVATQVSSTGGAQSMTARDDKIILAGFSFDPNKFFSGLTLVRYNLSGIIDSSFGTNGVVTPEQVNGSFSRSVVLQDSSILVAGYISNTFTFNNDFLIARFKWNGDLDSTFGKNGIVMTDIGGEDDARSIILQGDKILVGGITAAAFSAINSFVLVRYNKDGSIDNTFGENGFIKTGKAEDSYTLEQIVLDKDRLYAIGSINIKGTSNVGVVAAYLVGNVVTISCPPDAKATAAAGCSAVVNGIDPSLPDESASVSYTLTGATVGNGTGTASGTAFNVGITMVTYSLTDNPDVNCSFNVTVTAATEVCNGVDDDCDGVIDETCTEVIVTIDDVSVPESQPFAYVTVRLAGPATNKAVKVMYDIKDLTAAHPKDYMLYSRVPLLFAAGGQRTLTIPVQIFPDNTAEGNEQFEIRLKNVLNASIKDDLGIVTIVDDDLVTSAATESNSTLAVKASPNPSSTSFTVQLSGIDIKSRISIRVYDQFGRIMESREGIGAGQTIQVGANYKTGTYIIEAIQGTQRARTTVIKGGM